SGKAAARDGRDTLKTKTATEWRDTLKAPRRSRLLWAGGTMSTKEEKPQYRVTDVSAVRVARVYAEALLDAAAEQNQVQEVLDELSELVENVLGKEADLWAFLESPTISRERKQEVIARAF